MEKLIQIRSKFIEWKQVVEVLHSLRTASWQRQEVDMVAFDKVKGHEQKLWLELEELILG